MTTNIELVGGPHCGATYRVADRIPSVWRAVHALGNGESWEAFYCSNGQKTTKGDQRYDYTEQRRIIRPAAPPPVVPGPDGAR